MNNLPFTEGGPYSAAPVFFTLLHSCLADGLMRGLAVQPLGERAWAHPAPPLATEARVLQAPG